MKAKPHQTNSRIFACARSFILVGACALAFIPAAPAADYTPRHTSAHVLSSGDLTVEVMEPNDPARYNQGFRFSPVANVLRAVKNGKDYLFSPVAHDPEKDNCGLAMEFDITSAQGPPGFSEAAVEEGFLKIGVGVLRKTEMDYKFYSSYEMIEPAKTTVRWEEDRATFEQVSAGVNGYAYKLNAVVTVQAGAIDILYRLTNTGTKAFSTDHYAHNYFCFDNAPVGPNYEVLFPYEFEATGMEAFARKDGQVIFYDKTLGKSENINVPMPKSYSGPNTVKVRHSGNGQEITATTSIPGTRTFVHASASYLCPEQFVCLSLKPGESTEWTRHYELKQNPR